MEHESKPLKVVFCWHMHQPEYRSLTSGQYQQPWTYLHAIKDYIDMVAHLEAVPEACAVVNFAPTLLEQISDYAVQVRGYLEQGSPISDPLLAALDAPALPRGSAERANLVRLCLRANEYRLIERYPDYRRLAERAKLLEGHPELITYFSDQFLIDLIIWYHLAWIGETVRRQDKRIKKLMKRRVNFAPADRRFLLEIIADLLEQVIPRYKRLAERGQIELSVTPYAHPIVPLMLSLQSARESIPEAPLPESSDYPGGAQRARWHIEEGKRVFKQHFGFEPKGCWPSEGGISDGTLQILNEAGFTWTATGETVLVNSRIMADKKTGGEKKNWLHRPYRLVDTELDCYFRDDGLSDLIGFTYADWHADDAVANLMHHLENIHASSKKDAVVSIIMDGENAWETYFENGYYFLRALYRKLSDHPNIELTTFSRCASECESKGSLPAVVAGSWVYGTFSTWIGEKDKNRAWDMLCEAKLVFDQVIGENRLDEKRLTQLERQLAICEGSDWFWWFGDYNPAEAVQDFERLYREHLVNLYQLMSKTPPDYLFESFSYGGGSPQTGGVMRRGQE